MARTSKNAGDTLQYTNTTGAAISSGDVVFMGAIVGVAIVDIAIGATGSVGVMGVYRDMPKVATGAIAQGAELTWDVSEAKFTTGAGTSGDLVGCAVAATAAGDGDETMEVLFTRAPGKITV